MELLKATKILQSNQLKVTDCRLDVLNIFINNNKAVSHADMENLINHDRVTLYRTINTFLDKDIIHRVPEGKGGGDKFALCVHPHVPASDDHKHNHEHVHFKCNICENTTCINDVHIPVISLPNGFILKEAFLLVNGTCDQCSVK